MGQINLFIVDDHSLFRQGLKSIFSDSQKYKIIGEASDGQEAI